MVFSGMLDGVGIHQMFVISSCIASVGDGSAEPPFVYGV